jgi:hypothetical protein
MTVLERTTELAVDHACDALCIVAARLEEYAAIIRSRAASIRNHTEGDTNMRCEKYAWAMGDLQNLLSSLTLGTLARHAQTLALAEAD